MHHWIYWHSSTLISNPDIIAWSNCLFLGNMTVAILEWKYFWCQKKETYLYLNTHASSAHMQLLLMLSRQSISLSWRLRRISAFRLHVLFSLWLTDAARLSLAKEGWKIMHFEAGMWTFRNTFPLRVAKSASLFGTAMGQASLFNIQQGVTKTAISLVALLTATGG